jgi:hypothetical protein
VIRPRGVDLHYEVELALILGKQVRDLNPQDEQAALDAIESESSPSQVLSPVLNGGIRLRPQHRYDGPQHPERG